MKLFAGRERKGQRRQRPNLIVLAGIALLITGVTLSVVSPGGAPRGDAATLLNQTLAASIQMVQRLVLWGDEALSERQPRFNSVVVAVFLEGLSPQQQRALAEVAGTTRTLAGQLFSLPSLLTAVALAVVYRFVARAFDSRLPGPSPAPEGETEGAAPADPGR